MDAALAQEAALLVVVEPWSAKSMAGRLSGRPTVPARSGSCPATAAVGRRVVVADNQRDRERDVLAVDDGRDGVLAASDAPLRVGGCAKRWT
ncbi:hypothetical protein [Streptomyces griseorubiginosus]|uniref:hypothetical protein n=1 Tax=Streptomyces griseorubiginosus TaxID=67304 RepID=UPI00340651CB